MSAPALSFPGCIRFNARLELEARLVALDRAEVALLLADELVLDLLGMSTSLEMPFGDGALVQSTGERHGWDRAALREQGQLSATS